jgi:hypothetical protein
MKSSTAFILILISAGLFYTFVMPEYSKVQALRAEAAQYQGVLGHVSDLSQKRDALLLKYNAIPQQDIDSLEKILPDNVNVVELALDLDSIASKYGISIKNVQTVKAQDQGATSVVVPVPSGPYQKANISFSFISTYDNFRKFERDLEQSLSIIDVKTASFNTADSGLDEFQMQIETYWTSATSTSSTSKK